MERLWLLAIMDIRAHPIGTKPSQAAKSRPLAKAAPLPMAATMALAMSGPMPGTVIYWSAPVTDAEWKAMVDAVA
jgi:hypothetical protein